MRLHIEALFPFGVVNLLLLEGDIMGAKDIKAMQGALVILLIHVVKILLENKVTNSWRGSIYSSLCNIKHYNVNKNKSLVIKHDGWFDLLENQLINALTIPSWECFDGRYKGDINTVKAELNTQECFDLAMELLNTNTHKVTYEEIDRVLHKYLT